ncbi:MAG: hypothetical protein F6Q11_02400 [Thermoplasma sp.]|nr:MAG: hypothetical protein F6Q11_02400 [Thermoplasma sp.]
MVIMSLIVTDILKYYEPEINDDRISKLYITTSRKVLGQAYSLQNKMMVVGKLLDVAIVPDKEKITETAVPGRDRLIGTKLEAYFFTANGSDRDYLFFSSKFSHILTEYAIFAEEYEVKVEFIYVQKKIGKIKLYTKGTVMDSYRSQESESVG